jgi:L-ascorbate metabolism protein UlaG (beta-lactamase superfamily)
VFSGQARDLLASWRKSAIIGIAGMMLVSGVSGCTESDVTKDSGRPAHHVSDGGFRNPPGSPPRDYSGWTFARFLIGRFTDFSTPIVPSGHAVSFVEAATGMNTANNPSLTWLGHAAFLIRTGGAVVLTDPYLGKTAGPAGFGPSRFVPPAMGVKDLPPIDILVISHNHYDHLDAWTIDRLPGKDRMVVIAPLGVGDFFRERGYANVVDLDWHDEHRVGGVTVRALPAVHFSGRGLGDRNETLWASFAIESGDGSVWFSGDTAYGDVFKEIGSRYGPFDLALIGIGAYEPREIMKSSHATPEEAVEIGKDIRAAAAVGMHWGTVKLTPEDPFEAAPRFVAAARAQGLGDDWAWIMQIGETRDWGASAAALQAAGS